MASNKDKGDDTAREGPWVELKRQVNLMSDVANIVGFMVGCGSFMSQQGILGETGRVGMSLIMWVLCASLAMTAIIIQQAVFKGSSIGAPVTTAITLLPQIPVSFSMQQGRKHHLEKLLGCIVILLCCLPICQGMAILEGNPANFSCSVANLETSLWQVRRPDGTFQPLAQSGVLYSHYRDKFQLEILTESSGSNTSYLQTLTLNKATVDDDGEYRCEEDGYFRTSTNLTVESTPLLHLEINNTATQTSINVVLNREVAVDCIAEGGKPPVTLSWRVNGEEVNGRFIDDPPPSHGRVTSTIHLLPTMEIKTLACVAKGQEVTPQTNVSVGLNVQYLPNCVLGITEGANAYGLTCSCNANPEVKKYEIYVNGLLFSNESKTTLPLENPATVFCNVTNDVGSFVTLSEDLAPFRGNVPWWIALLIVGGLIVIAIVVIAVVVTSYMWKKRNAAMAQAQAANDRFNTSHQAGLDAAVRLQAVTRPKADEQKPMIKLRADQGDNPTADSEGEGEIENGTTKHGRETE